MTAVRVRLPTSSARIGTSALPSSKGTRSGGLGKLPVCVVKMRSALRFTRTPNVRVRSGGAGTVTVAGGTAWTFAAGIEPRLDRPADPVLTRSLACGRAGTANQVAGSIAADPVGAKPTRTLERVRTGLPPQLQRYAGAARVANAGGDEPALRSHRHGRIRHAVAAGILRAGVAVVARDVRVVDNVRHASRTVAHVLLAVAWGLDSNRGSVR